MNVSFWTTLNKLRQAIKYTSHLSRDRPFVNDKNLRVERNYHPLVEQFAKNSYLKCSASEIIGTVSGRCHTRFVAAGNLSANQTGDRRGEHDVCDARMVDRRE